MELLNEADIVFSVSLYVSVCLSVCLYAQKNWKTNDEKWL